MKGVITVCSRGWRAHMYSWVQYERTCTAELSIVLFLLAAALLSLPLLSHTCTRARARTHARVHQSRLPSCLFLSPTHRGTSSL